MNNHNHNIKNHTEKKLDNHHKNIVEWRLCKKELNTNIQTTNETENNQKNNNTNYLRQSS